MERGGFPGSLCNFLCKYFCRAGRLKNCVVNKLILSGLGNHPREDPAGLLLSCPYQRAREGGGCCADCGSISGCVGGIGGWVWEVAEEEWGRDRDLQ